MHTIHSILSLVLSAEALRALGDVYAAALAFLVALCALVGAASKVVVALKVLARIFKAWSARTEMSADDKAAFAFASILDAVGDAIDWCRSKLEPLALNKAGDGKAS
jgi:hypothetical protein